MLNPLPNFSPNPLVYYGLLVFCLLLGFGLLWLAWRRPRRRQRLPRLLASAVAAAALWFVAFPPVRSRPAARAEAILLTENYAPDTLRQLLQQLGPGTPVWAYGAVPTPASASAKPLASLLTLSEQRPALRCLHVLGRGLPAADAPLLGTLPVRLHGGAAYAGFQAAFWPAKVVLGEEVAVEGTVGHAGAAAETPAAGAADGAAGSPTGAAGVSGGAPTWVVLRAAGAGRDSVSLPAGGGAFRLRYRPKTAGLATYELLLRRPGQLPLTEPVPVEVTVPVLPTVLLLTAVPSFEFKFLKNYLAEAHYPVALRTTVSRGLVQTDFTNQPARPLDRLTPTLLAGYSVLIADAATLAALTPAEAQAMQAAVAAGRLGLIALAEAAPLPRALPAHADFAVLPRAGGAGTTLVLSWPNAPAEVRATLPAQLRPTAALRPLVSGPNQLLAAAARRVGLGFVVVSVVPETFRWSLQGRSSGYASFWNQLLTAAVPPAAPAAAWHAGTRWPRSHQPLTLHLTSAFPAAQPTVAPLTGGPAVRLALRQDPRLPEWSTGQYWPAAAGWHQAAGPGQTTFRFYVYSDSAWAGPELRERQLVMGRRIAAASASPVTAAAEVPEPWPALWFFGLFLLAAGYLWLEEKL